jgi:hypothetical protein
LGGEELELFAGEGRIVSEDDGVEGVADVGEGFFVEVLGSVWKEMYLYVGRATLRGSPGICGWF